ncbi:hypothetical protein [Kribbella qitaiheensis]|uniref:hypothetical protein n=1 Tax=Kribbella qitaiheensis TaxID=1544730 RepID=UPI001628E6EE|nr:hypothetical protein [Kribbella qitaiheensis]
MSFLERSGLVETEAQERARLADSPPGSTNHYLSTLAATIAEWPQDLLVELPWTPPRTTKQHRVVVVPIEYRRDSPAGEVDPEELPRRRNCGLWVCAVVLSDHPSYPVGGHRIVVSAAEIARGHRIDLG